MSAHLLGAWLVAVGLAGVGIASAVGLATRRRPFLEDRLILATLTAILVAIATGGLMLVGGGGPRDGLHLLYAAAVLAVLPVARFAFPAIGSHRRGWLLMAGCLLAAGLLVRLAQTG